VCSSDLFGNSSMRFVAAIYRGEELLLTGEVIYVHADQTTRRPTPIPDSFKQNVTAFEYVTPEQAAPAVQG
uniref:acyl-CoA thioesterase n=2 Tax=Alloalcanivorax venustensis TaxID=172371 RepID=UPI00355965A6